MRDVEKPFFKFIKSIRQNPGVLLAAFTLFFVVSCGTLQYQAQNHPLGTLQQASPLFIASLRAPLSIDKLAVVLDPSLLKSLDVNQLNQALQTPVVDGSFLTHLYTHSVKRSPEHSQGALAYYKTPVTRLQVRWQVTTEWFTSVGLYGHFWRVEELCWENAKLNAIPCTFDPQYLP